MSATRGVPRGFRIGTHFSTIKLIAALILLCAIWEAIAIVIADRVARPDLVLPRWESVLGTSFRELANYYAGSFGGTPPSQGGAVSVGNAFLAVAENLAFSLGRVVGGLAIGVTAGVLLAFGCTSVRAIRDFTLGLANSLRMLPLLALAPLFTLWFGADSAASVAFIAFAVGLVMLFATISAVANLPKEYEEYARTLGASRWQRNVRVVVPAIMPEIGNALILCVPLAWGVLLASELFGIQNGLGWMMGEALGFSLVGRVTAIAMVFVVVIFAFLALVKSTVRATTRWAR